MQLIVQHSNVAYELGPLRNHLSIGQIHHLHHVNWGKEGDCNFGLFLTLWDKLFGTFQAEAPRKITAGDMGVDELPNFPTRLRRAVPAARSAIGPARASRTTTAASKARAEIGSRGIEAPQSAKHRNAVPAAHWGGPLHVQVNDPRATRSPCDDHCRAPSFTDRRYTGGR